MLSSMFQRCGAGGRCTGIMGASVSVALRRGIAMSQLALYPPHTAKPSSN
ncbi:hypothetical protein RR46_01720 [Papilio xuthus]|uniref:Uncharacterized protein n=1 Tax=Papilio xuthus TaxID=66420 RepID=A0A194QLM9_PAPXU|nr:hypothetical protein RR46_01720 [Papilio xuthus]